MQSVLEILKKTAGYVASKGIPEPKLDAEYLLANTLGCKRLDLYLRFDEPLPESRLAPLREAVRRRAKREPLQHILGSVDFFGITLKCDARALVPRRETEEMCELAAEKILASPEAEAKILDLGTGSGAIALSLAAKFKSAEVSAADVSDDALSLARENAEALAIPVKFFKSDWFENVAGKFDLIISNPPYLTAEEAESAEPEVRGFDPRGALVAPDGGMGDLKKILSRAREFLEDGGILVCECGLGQPEILAREAAEKFGYSSAQTAPDLSKRERFLICKK